MYYFVQLDIPASNYGHKKDFPVANFEMSFLSMYPGSFRRAYLKIPKATFKTRSTKSCHGAIDFDQTIGGKLKHLIIILICNHLFIPPQA